MLASAEVLDIQLYIKAEFTSCLVGQLEDSGEPGRDSGLQEKDGSGTLYSKDSLPHSLPSMHVSSLSEFQAHIE